MKEEFLSVSSDAYTESQYGDDDDGYSIEEKPVREQLGRSITEKEPVSEKEPISERELISDVESICSRNSTEYLGSVQESFSDTSSQISKSSSQYSKSSRGSRFFRKFSSRSSDISSQCSSKYSSRMGSERSSQMGSEEGFRRTLQKIRNLLPFKKKRPSISGSDGSYYFESKSGIQQGQLFGNLFASGNQPGDGESIVSGSQQGL